MNKYEELHRWLDEKAENDISTEEILQEYGLTMEDASEQADLYREKFFELLRKYGVCSDNISVMIAELDRLIYKNQNEDLLFIYTALATEKGLLFGNMEDEEQKILCWLEQSGNAEKFSKAIRMEKTYKKRLESLSGFSEIPKAEKTDTEEQVLLYQMALQHDFLYKGRKSNFFLENTGELVRKVNANPKLKVIKPYVYSAVLSRKHKLMTDRKNYSPNFANIFERTDYKIKTDNGKNFDTYQSYLELYDQLRRHYQDESDIDFSDYCFAHLSNLNEWYYENCELNEEIPMTLERMAKQLITRISLKTPQNTTKKQPVLEIAYQNILLNETDWLDMIWEVQKGADISDYCERLYQMAGGARICKDRKLALQYAELYLCIFMEDINRRILMNDFKYFL
ncbi:MAG: hypothetical protein NC205_08445 [Prevotella sp.]|nr:hypothetical protein [Alistipes senegalensis]MCM1358613.1 hypothetical protein [Prevotella sp.]